MRIAKDDIPVRIDAPGAVARVKTDFGDASGYGKIGGEYFSLGAGADIAPLLKGLEGDLCQGPALGHPTDSPGLKGAARVDRSVEEPGRPGGVMRRE